MKKYRRWDFLFSSSMIKHGWVTTWGMIIGASIGIKFPDIDLQVNGLIHRSILTHACWLPLLLFGLTVYADKLVLRAITIAVCVTMVVHFCFDLFPNGWSGYALIHVPGIGRLPAVVSFAWLSLSALLSLIAAMLLVRNILEIGLALVCIIMSFVLLAHEGLLWPIIAFLIILGLVELLTSLVPPHVLQNQKERRTL